MFRLSLCLVLVLGHCCLARGHELPDGEIERRVQVSVKPDCVLVQYSLAMNEGTLEKELRKHGQKPAETFALKWKQYEGIILRSLPTHMRLTIDGKPSAFKPIRADYSGWSHRHLTCLLKAEILLAEQRKTIILTDSNLLNTPGSYRIAMKGRSGAKMENSTVPPLVTRAKPVKLTSLTNKQKQVATRAQADFALEQGR